MWYAHSVTTSFRLMDVGKEERGSTSLKAEASGNEKTYSCALVKNGRVIVVKKAEGKRASLLANLGDINRPLRVRPVRYMGREWWAVDAEDTWPGMVMDLRRLGFESIAMGEEVLVREGGPVYEPQMEGPNALGGLKPFPTVHPTIQIRKEAYSPVYEDLTYLDEYDENEELEEDELEPEELNAEDV